MELRKISNHDIKQKANLLATSFEDKFIGILWKDTQKNEKFLWEVFSILPDEKVLDIGAYQWNTLLWVISLVWLANSDIQSKYMQEERKIFNLMKKFGFVYVIRFLFWVLLLHHACKKSEVYIDFIAVSEQARWKWVWWKLLRHAEKIARKNNMKIYSLYVADDNRAKNLYLREWFTVKNKNSSLLTQILFDRRDWLYMVKDIK